MEKEEVRTSYEQVYGAFGGAKYLLTGTTESGKTTFVSKLVNPIAVELIKQMVGQGSSTLKPKTFVLSSEKDFEEYIRVCAKPHSQPLNRKDYDEVIMDTFVSLAKQASKANNKRLITAEQLLTKGFIQGENHVSFLGLLNKQAEQWISETDKIINLVQEEALKNLHDIARGRLEDPHAAKSKKSELIDTKLAEVIRDFLDGSFDEDLYDLLGKEIGLQLANQYININKRLMKAAEDFFGNDEFTKDGYLTIDFPLSGFFDERLDEKRNSLFCNNSNENEISIEVLFEEIVVYVGINPGLVGLLGDNSKKFLNRNGCMELGLIDTMGAFHRYSDKNDAKIYFNDLARAHDYDGMILLIPLILGANEKKFLRLASGFLQQFPFDLDVIIMSNKADNVIDQFKKEWDSKNCITDPFGSITESKNKEMDPVELKEHLLSKIKIIEQEVIKCINEQGNGRVNVLAHLVTSFIENEIESFGIDQIKNIRDTTLDMVKYFANAKNTVDKISIKFNSDYGSDIGMHINRTELQKGMLNIIDLNMFSNVLKNCYDNLGKTPHGQSFNALPSRLSYGEGYKVILEQRFTNVESFEITFPGLIRNSLDKKKSDIILLLKNCIQFEGIKNITLNIEDALLSRIASRLTLRNIVASIVYIQTFRPVMIQPHYAFGSKFRSYIRNVKNAHTDPKNCDIYVKAFEEEVHRAFKFMLDSDVLYQK